MSNLSMCRLCLAYNVPTFNLLGTQLQEIYEKLTENELLDHNKPISACYICHAKLKKCLSLRNTSLNAESALQMILQATHEITYLSITLIDRKYYSLNSNLSLTEAHNLNYVPQSEGIWKDNKSVSVDDFMKTEDFMKIKKDEFCDANSTQHSDSDLFICDMQLDKLQTELNFIKSKASSSIIGNEKTDIIKVLNDNKNTVLNSASSKDYLKKKIARKKSRRKKATKPREQLSCGREIVLTQEQSQDLIKKRMDSNNFKNSPYKCSFCYKGYFEQRAYENHLTFHDEKSGKFECDICKMRYKSRRDIFVHIKRNHYYLYQCKLCPYTCRQAFVMKLHNKLHSGFTHNCEKCEKKFKRLSNLIQHTRVMHSTDIVCTVCGTCLYSQKGLKDHMQYMHRELHDSKDFNKVEGLSEEFKVQENDDTKKCLECSLQFNNTVALKRHLLKSKKHRLEIQVGRCCLVCGEELAEISEMCRKSHMKKHFREINFDPSITCDECDKVCGSVNSFRKHKSRDHSISNEGQKGSVVSDKVVCEVCGKTVTKLNLKVHQRLHTGEKPYACEVCCRRFRALASVQNHRRTHTGEKPFRCDLCAASFRCKPTLVNHRRVHTGEKPYKCEVCDKAFSQIAAVQSHVRTVHKKLPSKYKHKNKQIIVADC